MSIGICTAVLKHIGFGTFALIFTWKIPINYLFDRKSEKVNKFNSKIWKKIQYFKLNKF